MCGRTAGDLRQLAQSFGGRLSGIQTIHRRGEPEDVIPEFVVAQRIDLVIMGTVARSGIAGLLIGKHGGANTEEVAVFRVGGEA